MSTVRKSILTSPYCRKAAPWPANSARALSTFPTVAPIPAPARPTAIRSARACRSAARPSSSSGVIALSRAE
ncbi:hypothetical protein [Acrocarpospora corrugata]|uniref:hypothetical protein n=1 Tax=Acrocarpospora corrugata TaxID=35763 RepID=UPI00147840AF|nr:hypothetical protein [Acrocarpospora corrugata]